MNSDITGWRLVGELVRQRRERMGLRQEDMPHGPSSATLRKVEHGDTPVPARTQHRLEASLGWDRGDIERALRIHDEPWWANDEMRRDYVREMVEPPPAPPAARMTAADLSDEELLAELTYRMRRYATERNPDAPITTMFTAPPAEPGSEARTPAPEGRPD